MQWTSYGSKSNPQTGGEGQIQTDLHSDLDVCSGTRRDTVLEHFQVVRLGRWSSAVLSDGDLRDNGLQYIMAP